MGDVSFPRASPPYGHSPLLTHRSPRHPCLDGVRACTIFNPAVSAEWHLGAHRFGQFGSFACGHRGDHLGHRAIARRLSKPESRRNWEMIPSPRWSWWRSPQVLRARTTSEARRGSSPRYPAVRQVSTTSRIPTRKGPLGESSSPKPETYPATAPWVRVTRRISDRARARSAMKFITRAEATTSNVASGKAALAHRRPGSSRAGPPACGRRARSCRRRVDREHGCGRAGVEDQFSEQPRAATNIKPARAAGWCQPIKEHGTGGTAPAPDKALIGGAIVETDRCVCDGQARRS